MGNKQNSSQSTIGKVSLMSSKNDWALVICQEVGSYILYRPHVGMSHIQSDRTCLHLTFEGDLAFKNI